MTYNPAVTKEEWARLREEARQALPQNLQHIDHPDLLLHYQQEVIATLDAYPVVVVEKSRRIGLTWGIGSYAALTSAAARSAGGMDTMYIGYNLDMAREFIDVCAMWAKAYNQAVSEVDEFVFKDKTKDGDRDIQAFRITFASGYEIVALSSRPRSLRGKQGLVIIDEAAFHDDLNELLKAAIALLMWGGKVLVISTHDGDMNPFNVLCEEIRKGRSRYKLLTFDFDSALRDGLYQRICLVTGKEWSVQAEADWREEIVDYYGEAAEEELFAIPSTGSGTYLPGALIERQQRPDAPVLRIERPNDFLLVAEHLRAAEINDWCERNLLPLLSAMDPRLPSYYGHDYARSGDLSVGWPGQVGQDMVRRCAFVVEMWNIPYAQQRQIVWYILDRLPRFGGAAMDATGNGEALAEETATRYGLHCIDQVKINEAWYRTVMPRFKAAFEDAMIELPQDLDVYNDHRAIKLVKGVAQVPRESRATGKGEDAKKRRGKSRHGDSAIADLMFYTASCTEASGGEILPGPATHAATMLQGFDGYTPGRFGWPL